MAAARARDGGADHVAAAATGLARAAGAVAEHVAGRRVAAQDPAALAALLVEDNGEGWACARDRLSALLGLPARHVVIRVVAGWLAGQLFDPQEPGQRAATAELLVRTAVQARRDPVPGAVLDPPPGVETGPGPG